MKKMTLSPIPTEISNRIIAAADVLYAQLGGERFPTVDAVRRLSSADMNAATVVMRQWRKTQSLVPVGNVEPVPEVLQQAYASATAGLWQVATELANQTLSNALAARATERLEMEGLQSELATSYDKLTTEFDAVTTQLAHIESANIDLTKSLLDARTLEAKALDELNRMTTCVTGLEADMKTWMKMYNDAKESSCVLTGKLEFAMSQNAELLNILKPVLNKIDK